MSTITSVAEEGTLVPTAYAAAPPKVAVWESRLSEIFWVNSVAISDNGKRVVGATYLHDYSLRTGKGLPNVKGRFAVQCFDGDAPTASDPKKKPLWTNEYDGWDGVFGVAISGDGTVAAAAGFLERYGEAGVWGLLRAYDAANGKSLLDSSSINQRVSWVTLSTDGRVLAAVADDVYVFLRSGRAFNPVPLTLGIRRTARSYVTNVALHPSGTWLAACDNSGHVYMAKIDRAAEAITHVYTWTAQAEVPFLSVAIAKDSGTFVVGGGNSVLLFDSDAVRTDPDALLAPLVYDTTAEEPKTLPANKPDGRIQENVRWVAISADGMLLSAVANLTIKVPSAREDNPAEENAAGLLLALTPSTNQLRRLWVQVLENSPNSTSIDADGKYVAASDGYPTGQPAKFYLFDADAVGGTKRWHFGTHNMNWPIAISADASAIVAGSDDGTVYYFEP